MTNEQLAAVVRARELLSLLMGRIEITEGLRDEIAEAEAALWRVLFPGAAQLLDAARRETDPRSRGGAA